MISKSLVSIILPVYNNSESIPELLERIGTVALSVDSSYLFEVVLIDDGSSDGSWDLIRSLVDTRFEVIVRIKLSRNFGQVAAVMAGWEHCSGDLVINMSADLQDPPELIVDLLKKYSEGNDLVCGQRETRGDGFIARITSRFASFVLGRHLQQDGLTWFDVSLMSRRILDVVLATSGPNRFYQRDMVHAGFRQAKVLYHRKKRPYGRSGFNLKKRLKIFMDCVVDSSYYFIHFFTISACVLTVGSLIYAIWIIIARTFGLIPSSGWAPIMVVQLVSSGFIMLMLGFIGEYLWRIYDAMRSRPVYVIECKTLVDTN